MLRHSYFVHSESLTSVANHSISDAEHAWRVIFTHCPSTSDSPATHHTRLRSTSAAGCTDAEYGVTTSVSCHSAILHEKCASISSAHHPTIPETESGVTTGTAESSFLSDPHRPAIPHTGPWTSSCLSLSHPPHRIWSHPWCHALSYHGHW